MNDYYNNLVLFTKRGCHFCRLLEPEWRRFEREMEPLYAARLVPRATVQCYVYDGDADRGKRLKREMRERWGITGFPTLVLFVHGRAHKPAFFDVTALRTWPALVFAALVVYHVGLGLARLQPHHRAQLETFFQPGASTGTEPRLVAPDEIRRRVVAAAAYDVRALFLAANLPLIRRDLQRAVDCNYSGGKAKDKVPQFDAMLAYALTPPEDWLTKT